MSNCMSMGVGEEGGTKDVFDYNLYGTYCNGQAHKSIW